MAEYSTEVDRINLTFVQWYDNKEVNLLSTYVVTEPKIIVKRWFSAEKTRKEIDCPQIISTYNQHIGSVDLLDSLMGLYRITIRSKKWYHRLFFHYLDMAVVNAWLWYRRAHSQKSSSSQTLRLEEFKAEIAEGLCKAGKGASKKRTAGRPSLDSQIKKARHRQSLPIADVRTDDTSH
ncbi:piggyBac transposable element-derived protein 2-like [Hydra vulgaris]|uniref:piggyBac transposable element-derived protein 2-like n=1 Tax=Hydra vulgaris TaxID=6087 RepID=UPI001F5E8F73|nr:piggyBac transposable element-derived protein 2-like [Hydra vulgaris]